MFSSTVLSIELPAPGVVFLFQEAFGTYHFNLGSTYRKGSLSRKRLLLAKMKGQFEVQTWGYFH
jgi:hypothetical protein